MASDEMSSSSSSPSKWKEPHQRAAFVGYSGTLDEYIGLYKYVKRVIRACNSGFDVSPTKVNGFQVKPMRDLSKNNTVSTFTITPSSECKMPDLNSRNTTRWLVEMREDIEIRLKGIEIGTPKFDELKRREHLRDNVLKERRKQASIIPKAKLPSNAVSIVRESLQKSPDSVLVSKFGIDFTTKDLATLNAGVWLNDEVINFYMQLIQERSQVAANNLPSVHVFSTFFYPKLIKMGYSAVRTSTRRITPSVLTRDLILIPIHLTAHWCMACIDLREKRISYYDSLGGNNTTCLAALKEWLMSESEDKLGVPFDLTGWTNECCHDIPHQENGSDCGVFAITFAEYLSRRASFSFHQRDMPQFRCQIAYEILQGALLNS